MNHLRFHRITHVWRKTMVAEIYLITLVVTQTSHKYLRNECELVHYASLQIYSKHGKYNNGRFVYCVILPARVSYLEVFSNWRITKYSEHGAPSRYYIYCIHLNKPTIYVSKNGQ